VHRLCLGSPVRSDASGHRRSIILFTVGALVAPALSSLLIPATHASADQIGTLAAQAKRIAEQLIQDQLEAGAYRQQYSVATERVLNDQRAITQSEIQIQSDLRMVAVRERDVRRIALMSYIFSGSVSAASGPGLFTSNVETVRSENVYATVSVGNLNEGIVLLHTAQSTAQAEQGLLLQQQADDKANQVREASYLQQANTTTQRLESVQAQVTGQLATAVAQQRASAAAAAAAAVAAAERQSVHLSDNSVDPALPPFLQCVRQAESGGNYAAVSPDGQYMGAFQFDQPTWNYAAQAANRPDLVGVPPNTASRADQDTLAITLYSLDGERPWLGDRCSSSG
jgi:hypothetical protein